MCGRFALYSSSEDLQEYYQTTNIVRFDPHYNIPPQADIVAVLTSDVTTLREMHILHWGLIPHWAKDSKLSARLINARAETVAEKPAFRDSFRKRRCIIPANGFYEWQREVKQPYFVSPKEGVMSFAGIWDRWQSPEGETITSCSIITTDANPPIRVIHDRVPVALRDEEIDVWLDRDSDPQTLKAVLTPLSDEDLQMWPVDKEVNKAANDYPALIKKVG